MADDGATTTAPRFWGKRRPCAAAYASAKRRWWHAFVASLRASRRALSSSSWPSGVYPRPGPTLYLRSVWTRTHPVQLVQLMGMPPASRPTDVIRVRALATCLSPRPRHCQMVVAARWSVGVIVIAPRRSGPGGKPRCPRAKLAETPSACQCHRTFPHGSCSRWNFQTL